MKYLFLVTTVCCSILASVASAKIGGLALGTGFGAPTIYGTANVSNATIGDIVFDTDPTTTGFYGYTGPSPALGWVSLSGATSAPVGALTPFAGSTPPAGYLACDGSAVSRTTYSALFAVIGTTYGVGDGSTTFNLPDARGVFLRGVGSQTVSGVTYTGTQGVTEGDQFQAHKHSSAIDGQNPLVNSGAGAASGGGFYSAATTFAIGSATTDGSNGTPRTGSETRPANISVLYVIKY